MRRTLLLPFPLLAFIIGMAYLLGDPARTVSPSFSTAKDLLPLRTWGLLFLAGAAVQLIGLALGHRRLTSAALIVGGSIYVWWATLFAAAALTDPKASLTGWAVHGTVAYSHFLAAWRIRVTA